MRKRNRYAISGLATITMVSWTVGCGPKPAAPVAPPKASVGAKSTGAHGHGAGPHDGAVADWGGGKFHVEFLVDHDKQEATVYVLGGDEKTAAAIKSDKILLSIDDPKFQVELKPKPQGNEPAGTASRFVGTHASLGKVQEFSGSISGEANGTPYSGNFKEEPH